MLCYPKTDSDGTLLQDDLDQMCKYATGRKTVDNEGLFWSQKEHGWRDGVNRWSRPMCRYATGRNGW